MEFISGVAVYYLLLIPATLPVIIFFLLLAWIGRKFFLNN